MPSNLRVDFNDSIVETKEYNFAFTVPSVPNFPEEEPSRYVVYLPETPLLTDINKMPAISGLTRIIDRLPFAGEFRTVDSISRLIPHRLEFNQAQANAALTCHFYGIGSPINAGDILTEENVQNKIGYYNSKNNVSTRQYIFNQDDHPNLLAAIQALDTNTKTIFLKNGTYSIPNAVLDFSAKNILELKGESRDGVKIVLSGQGGITGNEEVISNLTLLFNSDIGSNQYLLNNFNECIHVNILPNNHTTKVGIGIQLCKKVQDCKVDYLNKGYDQSKRMRDNEALSNCTTKYNLCYADNGTSYPVANTPNGGFNI